MISLRNILRNSYSNTKIRVLKSRLPDIQLIVKESSRSTFEDTLTKIAEQFNISPDSPSQMKKNIYADFYTEICRIPGFFNGAQKDFLDALVYKYKLDIIKSKCFSLIHQKSFVPFYAFPELEPVFAAENFQQLLGAAEKTFWHNAVEDIIISASKQSDSVTAADSLLGISYFKYLKKQINGLDTANKKIVLKIIGPVIDFKKFIFYLRLVYGAGIESAKAVHMLWGECFFVPVPVFKEIYSLQSVESSVSAGAKYFYGAPVTKNLSEIEQHFFSVQKILWERQFTKCQFDIDLALLYILKREQTVFAAAKILDAIRADDGAAITDTLECNVF